MARFWRSPPEKIRTWQRLLLAAGSGLLTALALPPLSLWPLAWVSLIPLWWLGLAAATMPWWQATTWGLVWGLAYYGVSLVWITHLHPLMWLGISWANSLAIALGAWAFITGWGSVCTALWSLGLWWLVRHWPHHRALRLLGGAALWCGLEALRNASPLDWSPLSLTQSPGNLWVLHLARLSGPAVITALLVAVNGVGAEILYQRCQATAPQTSQNTYPAFPFTDPPGPQRVGPSYQPGKWLGGRPQTLVAVGLGLVLIGSATGCGLYYQANPDLPDQALHLGLIQGNIPTRQKLTLAGVSQALEVYSQGYKTLAQAGVDAVLTPEGALPVIWQDQSPTTRLFTTTVAQTGTPLWLGTFAPLAVDRAGQYTQSLLELRPDGHIHGRYNKVQLVPLGEYIPLAPLLGKLINRLSPLDSFLVPGQPHQTFKTATGIAAVGICYESAYSRLFRDQIKAGAEFIVTSSNNDPYPLAMMTQHHALDVLRAVESDRWALRVTNTGLSALVDSHGHTRWQGLPHHPILYKASLYRHHSQTTYVAWGDWLTPLLLGITTMWASVLKIFVKSP
ncbi:MAG: apolipoprotein N-acyltransferase [Nodosilinea sp.]